MAYTEQELKRIVELFEGIEANKSHEYAAPTYKDSPALKEIAEIALSQEEMTIEVLEEKIPALWYLTDSYDRMCRTGMSLKFYQPLLEAHARLIQLKEYSEEEMEQFQEAFYLAMRARNRYGKDECEDLLALVKEHFTEDYIAQVYKETMERREWVPKSDPVELTEEYLAVIDEVERLVEENKTMNFVLENWELRKFYLAEKGIDWISPAQLNPGVMFD